MGSLLKTLHFFAVLKPTKNLYVHQKNGYKQNFSFVLINSLVHGVKQQSFRIELLAWLYRTPRSYIIIMINLYAWVALIAVLTNRLQKKLHRNYAKETFLPPPKALSDIHNPATKQESSEKTTFDVKRDIWWKIQFEAI